MNRIVQVGSEIIQVGPEDRISVVGAMTGENLGAPIAYPPITPNGTAPGTNPNPETLTSKFWLNEDGRYNVPVLVGGAVLLFLLLRK